MKTCQVCGEPAQGYIGQESVDIDGQEQLVDIDLCSACFQGSDA